MKKVINWLMKDEFRAGALMIILLATLTVVTIELMEYFK